MSRTVLISFADGAFKQRAKGFLQGAASLELFDEATVFDLETLPAEFRAAHASYMQCTGRGFGYWIWKPQIILIGLENLAPDDVLIYIDDGCTLHGGGRRRFKEYLELARDHPSKMLSFQNVHTEAHWTKADLARRLGLSLSCSEMKTSQLSSGFLVLHKTSGNMSLVREWLSIALEDSYRYSDDSPSVAYNHPDFREHRHDQSIASLLRKCYGTAITHYEVHLHEKRFQEMNYSLPVWATRLRK